MFVDYHRCFFWSENIFWKEDIGGRRMTVALAGKDLIVDTEAVGRYLAKKERSSTVEDDWKYRTWKGCGVDILWFDKLDHAQIFDSKEARKVLVEVFDEYTSKQQGTAYGSIE